MSSLAVILGVSVVLHSVSFAQQSTSRFTQNERRIQDWIEQQCEQDPNVRYLNTHADAYGRMLRLRAAHALGISADDRSDANEPLKRIPDDSGVAVNVSKSKFTQQNETTIAIDRKDPKIVVAGANDDNMYVSGMPVYYTNNAGKNWSRTYVQAPASSTGTWVAMGDPVMAAGANGILYYAYIYGDPYTGPSIVDNFVVATSVNGRTWKNGSLIVPDDQIDGFEDKEALCVDNSPTSPYYGRVYLVWAHYDLNGGGETRIVYSDDTCQTWSTWTVIETSVEEFGSVKTGRNGEVLVSYSSVFADSLGNPAAYHVLYVSTDGASSFEMRPIHEYDQFFPNVTGYPALKGDYGPRCEPYMSFDVDLRNNDLHLVFGSEWNGDGAVQFYVKSTDLGQTWSEPIAVGYNGATPGTQPVLDRFCPLVSVNQRTGDAFLTCYSSERDPNNILTAPFRYHLNAAGDSSTTALEPNDFDPTVVGALNGGPAFIGDYIGADLLDSIYAAAWTEGVSSDGEVFVYLGLPKTTASSPNAVPMLVASKSLRLSSVYPNPALNGKITLNVYSPVSANGVIELTDVNGRVVAQLWAGQLEEGVASQISCSLPAVAAGSYRVTLRTLDASDQVQLVIR